MKIHSENIYYHHSFQDLTLEINNDKITTISLGKSKDIDIDYGTKRILPGFIDIHTHGAFGYDAIEDNPEGLRKWKKELLKEGVTGFLPTLLTSKKDILLPAIHNIISMENNHEGAHIFGIHLEGPYLSMKYKGAQPAEAIISPSIIDFEEYWKASQNMIKIMTIAPEEDQNHQLIKYMKQNGIVASIGHTSATFNEVMQAIHDGASSFTHTFNAMSPFHHRDIGCVGAALYANDIYSEIITDTYHVSIEAINLFFRCKDQDKAIIVTDSLLCKGANKNEKFKLGNHDIEIQENGSAILADSNGTLAGSTLYMNIALKNTIEKAKVPFTKAIDACTINPATLLKLNDSIGLIEENYDCDLVILDDDYQVIKTYLKGN